MEDKQTDTLDLGGAEMEKEEMVQRVESLVAQQTNIADFEKQGQKTSTALESRLVELQRCAENWQQRYDEDMEQLRQKLGVQQEMNVIEKEKLEALEALRVCKLALEESEKKAETLRAQVQDQADIHQTLLDMAGELEQCEKEHRIIRMTADKEKWKHEVKVALLEEQLERMANKLEEPMLNYHLEVVRMDLMKRQKSIEHELASTTDGKRVAELQRQSGVLNKMTENILKITEIDQPILQLEQQSDDIRAGKTSPELPSIFTEHPVVLFGLLGGFIAHIVLLNIYRLF